MSTKLSQPAMSHHFNKLVDAGVVSEEKRGTQKLYELNTALLKSIGIDVTKL
jgi:DNA-binding transcriptional ArsR family regulator